MNFTPITPPKKNSRIEKDGTRTMLVIVDIMLNGGTKFFATFKKRLPCRPDFELRRYTVDVTPLPQMIIERYPSLKNRDFNIAF